MTLSPLVASEVARLKKAATAASLATATVMIGLKVGAWAITDSISVLTSMMDSILDFSVGLMNFVAGIVPSRVEIRSAGVTV